MDEDPAGVFPQTTKGPLRFLYEQDIKWMGIGIYEEFVKESACATPQTAGIPS